jgi:hypothetical protein
MTPQAFIAKWRDNALSERAGVQPHFEDLCDLLGVKKPRDSESYQYKRGAARTGAGRGWADVWKKGCGRANRKVLERILKTAPIFEACRWYALADQP